MLGVDAISKRAGCGHWSHIYVHSAELRDVCMHPGRLIIPPIMDVCNTRGLTVALIFHGPCQLCSLPQYRLPLCRLPLCPLLLYPLPLLSASISSASLCSPPFPCSAPLPASALSWRRAPTSPPMGTWGWTALSPSTLTSWRRRPVTRTSTRGGTPTAMRTPISASTSEYSR